LRPSYQQPKARAHDTPPAEHTSKAPLGGGPKVATRTKVTYHMKQARLVMFASEKREQRSWSTYS
jgi:hypothetical protein